MLTKLARPLVGSRASPTLLFLRPMSMSNIFFQTASKSVDKSSKSNEKALSEQKSEKVLTVKDSLNDLSSVKWRTSWNGKRLWPHDQWPERDLVNYPPYKVRDVPNGVRWYFVPESWFRFFYDKTGVTGPYMFFYGLVIWGFSKEHIVLWYDFSEYLILTIAVITVVKKKSVQ